MELLTQKQLYFSAQIIGIRVREAIIVLNYKKSLSIKYPGFKQRLNHKFNQCEC